MMRWKATVRQSYIDLRGLNLGMEFVHKHGLQPGNKYSIIIEGLSETDIEGRLDKSGFIGGLSRLYKAFDLQVGDIVEATFDDPDIRLHPPTAKAVSEAEETIPVKEEPEFVFERQALRHVHIEPYAPGSLARWVPQTEADIYMVFGALSEYTDFQYCCGASKALLNALGYKAETKPDAILIDRASEQYLVAEFKMDSAEFTWNHKREDVDVLICWEDNEKDRAALPARVVGLRKLLEKAVKEGEIDL